MKLNTSWGVGADYQLSVSSNGSLWVKLGGVGVCRACVRSFQYPRTDRCG